MAIRGFEKIQNQRKLDNPFYVTHNILQLLPEINNQDVAVTQAFLKLYNNYFTISAEMILKSW